MAARRIACLAASPEGAFFSAFFRDVPRTCSMGSRFHSPTIPSGLGTVISDVAACRLRVSSKHQLCLARGPGGYTFITTFPAEFSAAGDRKLYPRTHRL